MVSLSENSTTLLSIFLIENYLVLGWPQGWLILVVNLTERKKELRCGERVFIRLAGR